MGTVRAYMESVAGSYCVTASINRAL
jgi:hypothetical protein